MAKKIMVINGPNLNMLGIREPEVYGSKSYADLEAYIENYAGEIGLEATVLQSNSEGEIIDSPLASAAVKRAACRGETKITNTGAR